VLEKQRRIDETAQSAGRDPAAIRGIANLSGEILDSAATEWLHGPPRHWIEELTQLVSDYGFDGFILSPVEGSVRQIERFATEVAPAVRSALGQSA
jgi:hypothetical protein